MEYRNAHSINSTGSIDCEIAHPKHGWIPYTLNPSDTDNTIDNVALLQQITDGNDLVPYTPPTQEEVDAGKSVEVREIRDYNLISVVDPVVSNALRWSDMPQEDKDVYITYRLDLLNIPAQAGFPHNIIWPIEPV